ncbi:MAG: type 1 glutamine amidotransferase [Phycisphaerae bacterium]|nr:type 1 glutamine amidotransferase [Phycisphaerae bacterium]
MDWAADEGGRREPKDNRMKALIIVHVSCEGPGLFKPVLEQRGVDVDIIDVEQGHALPDSLDGTDMLVVMGGPMNAYQEDKYPYLRQEDVLLREAISRDVPVMGVCLGSQLLAKAAGAKVYRGPVREFAWSDVTLTPAGRRDPLFDGIDSTMFVFQWHGDTFDVPSEAELIATSPVVPNQAIRVGRRAYGLQFHIELDRRLLDLWMDVAPGEGIDLDDDAVRRITGTFNDRETALARQARAVAENFHRIASAE